MPYCISVWWWWFKHLLSNDVILQCPVKPTHIIITSCPVLQLARFHAGKLNTGSALSGGKSLSCALWPLSQWPVRSTGSWVPSHRQGAFTVMLTLGRGHLQLHFKRVPSVMLCHSAMLYGLMPGWGPFRQHLVYALTLSCATLRCHVIVIPAFLSDLCPRLPCAAMMPQGLKNLLAHKHVILRCHFKPAPIFASQGCKVARQCSGLK